METQTTEERIDQIETRNRRVELDKAWETSFTRRGLIALFTYLSLGIYLWAIGIPRPWFNAIVPTLGFLISTLTMPWIKKLWIKRQG